MIALSDCRRRAAVDCWDDAVSVEERMFMNEITEVFSAEELQEVETTETVEEVEETQSPESEKVVVKEEPEKVDSQEEKSETTSEEETAKEEWTFAAVKDERQKRQKLEKELEELRASLDKKEEKAPDVFDDQEAYTKHLEQKFESKTKEQILNVQRDMMLEFKPDYEEKEKAFFEVAKDNPALIQQARNTHTQSVINKTPLFVIYISGHCERKSS